MKTGKMSQSIKRRIDNRAAVAAEANDRLNKYKRINADNKKKTKEIQIKPLPIEDNTKLTKDGVNEVSGFHPHFGCHTLQYQRIHPLHAPPDAPGRADFEHKFNSDSNEAMMASITDKRYDTDEAQANAAGWASINVDKATIAYMADQSKAMIAYMIAYMADKSKAKIASMNHTMNHNTAMMTKTMNSLKRDLDLLQLKHDAQTHRLAEVTSLCAKLKKAIPPQIKPKEDDDDFVTITDILDTNGDSMPDDGKTYNLVVTKMKRGKIIRMC